MNAMRVSPLRKGLFSTVGMVLLLLSTGAHGEIWCRRDFDRNNPVCVFSSAQDCVRAAGALGGICEREQLGTGAVKRCKPSRETKKRGTAGSTGCDAS